jgi:hypothetical protein
VLRALWGKDFFLLLFAIRNAVSDCFQEIIMKEIYVVVLLFLTVFGNTVCFAEGVGSCSGWIMSKSHKFSFCYDQMEWDECKREFESLSKTYGNEKKKNSFQWIEGGRCSN